MTVSLNSLLFACILKGFAHISMKKLPKGFSDANRSVSATRAEKARAFRSLVCAAGKKRCCAKKRVEKGRRIKNLLHHQINLSRVGIWPLININIIGRRSTNIRGRVPLPLCPHVSPPLMGVSLVTGRSRASPDIIPRK
jgi:hypothetical protein